jgi:hypothetical protein
MPPHSPAQRVLNARGPPGGAMPSCVLRHHGTSSRRETMLGPPRARAPWGVIV